MIIAVEGLDGAGKSTVADLLARAIDAPCIRLPPASLTLTTSALLREIDSDARYAYYLTGVIAVAELAHRSRTIVADRFVASAHAMHLDNSSKLAEVLRALPLPEPTLTIYLDVDEVTRCTRLERRGTALDPFEERLASDPTFRDRVARRMRAGVPTHVIDTTNREPEAIADEARQIWEEATPRDGV